jgi:hypothetical protein
MKLLDKLKQVLSRKKEIELVPCYICQTSFIAGHHHHHGNQVEPDDLHARYVEARQMLRKLVVAIEHNDYEQELMEAKKMLGIRSPSIDSGC